MNHYSNRRNKLMNLLPDNSMLILFSGKAPYRSNDEVYPFCVDRNFYYLTGLQAENMILVLSKNNNQIDESIFIEPYDEYLAKWVGGKMLAKDVEKISEIKNVQDINNFNSVISSTLNRNRKNDDFVIYFDFYHFELDQSASQALEFVNKLKENYPHLIFKDIYPHISRMRMIKDAYEISFIKKAINITKFGIDNMMKMSKPGINEMTMEGIFDFALKQSLCKETAFKTIAASGKRATILHYCDNNNVMQDNELFLCDLGATYNNYCADISRTFPVNGKFTNRQKQLYQVVLNANKIVENNAKPGISIKQLNQMVIDYYTKELPKLGLNEKVSNYYYHSCSHHLGLDTHDLDAGADYLLQVGNVITNEPGLYIEKEGIGIRIEDDLLISENGVEVLSKNIIKEIDDIEKYMAK